MIILGIEKPALITVGNVAHGLIQSYVYGYLQRIMTKSIGRDGNMNERKYL